MTVDRNFQASFQNDHLGQLSITMRFQGQPNLTFLTKILIIKVILWTDLGWRIRKIFDYEILKWKNYFLWSRFIEQQHF